jgi:hypothetical protein
MDKITDEELDRIEEGQRHEALLSALNGIADKIEKPDTSAVDALAKHLAELKVITAKIASKEYPVPAEVDLQPVVKALEAGIKTLVASQKPPPKAFIVVRDSYGVIQKIVVE